MTDLRTAAQQALEALESCDAAHPSDGGLQWYDDKLVEPAITALRAALAQQAEPVEPVAWIQPDHLQKARVAPFLCRVEPTQRFPDFVALYTAPPQRKPLTEEEIEHIGMTHQSLRQVVRAVERAHGIKE
jgi:hypothetical protein